MTSINYIQLRSDNFPSIALDHFIRYQEVKFSLQIVEKEPTFVPTDSIEDWSLTQRRNTAEFIQKSISNGGFAFGAMSNDEIIGFILVTSPFFGNKNQYLELKLFHVSAPYRNHGIGRKLFQLACTAAKQIGAAKLYISAHPAKETQLAYRQFGCANCAEHFPEKTLQDPNCIEMEYVL